MKIFTQNIISFLIVASKANIEDKNLNIAYNLPVVDSKSTQHTEKIIQEETFSNRLKGEVSKKNVLFLSKRIIFTLYEKSKSKLYFILANLLVLFKIKSHWASPIIACAMLFLNFLADIFPIFESIFTFFYPVYSTLAIFQFFFGYTNVLFENLLIFLNGESSKLQKPLLLSSLFLIIPLVVMYLFQHGKNEKRMKRNRYHCAIFLITALLLAFNFDLFEYLINLASSFSSNSNNGILSRILFGLGSGVLKGFGMMLDGTLNIIGRAITFYFSYNCLNQIYLSLTSFQQTEEYIPNSIENVQIKV
jgi:hypothetical protein